ncbi:MAG TPA: rhodanese-like domain-containing protein [Kiritimatiellia bacterium]|nr:rhodanese-like domain-containing protein [Kiritimatiellia bacterium]HMO98962.1 rhodanese-like domain-containing protein [Kiritimatiellia bacterium]HMP96414.1 rhodanese-like domain-containing protein [Kiritimatiellia bacterium]
MNRAGSSCTGLQMLMLLGATVALAAAASRFYEQPLPLDYPWSRHVEQSALETGMQVMTVAEAEAAVQSFSHIVLDARREADYLAGHLPGAMSLPANDVDAHFAMISSLLDPAMPIMVYCSGQDCDESLLVGRMVIDAGYTNVTLFVGGFRAWQEAGLPVQR